MRNLCLLMLAVGLCANLGCTSHSWTKIERTYVASYDHVFERVPAECKQCSMSVKKCDPQTGVMLLSARRGVDQFLTGSLFNWIGGDEVIVKVQRVGPSVTKVWIDSKARGQIGPDLGRTDRNVTSLAKVLDTVWPQMKEEQERGELRPVATAPSPPAE